MYSHAPKNYKCPFCLLAKNILDDDSVYTVETDIVFQNDKVTAFVSSHWWPNNKGHIIIIPNKHFENLYDLDEEYANEIHRVEKMIALAMKEAYKCDGISSRQHNEPAGNQEVFHYHLHVFPRYEGDNFYKTDRERVDEKLRKEYVDLIKKFL